MYSKCRISGILGNVRIHENSLIIQKYFRTPLKRGKKFFVPHENVSKYFGTPPFFTPPRYPASPVPGIKNDWSLTPKMFDYNFA